MNLSSRKRGEPEDKDKTEKDQNEQLTSNKKAKVSVTSSLSEPDEPPAIFDSLDDDCLGNVLDFVGKKCYSAFGRVNKRCHEMFCLKRLPKVTYLYGYAPLHFIADRERENNMYEMAKGVLYFNRMDILDWILEVETDEFPSTLKCLCWKAIGESSARLDILREVFHRANECQLDFLRDCYKDFDLCWEAAYYGKLEYLKFLRENECKWEEEIWEIAKQNGREHILEYLLNNGYPTEWQVESDSDSEDSSDC